MPLTRRDFLKLGGVTAVTATAAACNTIGRQVAKGELPESLALPITPLPNGARPLSAASPTVDPIWRFLNRAGYGPRPGDYERAAALGLTAYLEEQLDPAAIKDTAADLLLRHLSLYHMDLGELTAQEGKEAARELGISVIGRALYSKRQLYEAMVEFWSDHFNIYLRKNKFMPFLKIVDDREHIRPHALGKFRDLLGASVHSPAMLVYLDNIRNEKNVPNENYARELMELHTLGVHAGYTQQDVQELARVLTGWTVRRRGRREGQVFLNEDTHDFGEKRLLGQAFPAGRGEAEIEAALDMLAAHPATADFIAAKLVRHFVADEPPASLVERVAQTFRETEGDIKALLRVIFLSDEFVTAPVKLKRPFTFMISALRALHTDVRPNRQFIRWLEQLGQIPFFWPPPDGYPDVAPAWASNLLPRWNFALALVHDQIPGAGVPFERLVAAGEAHDSQSVLNLLAGLTLGRALDDETRTLFTEYTGADSLDNPRTQQRLKDTAALMLASPAFQWT